MHRLITLNINYMRLNVLRHIILFAVLALFSERLSAQFTISQDGLGEQSEERPLIGTTTNPIRLERRFFDYATWRAERMRLRKERNDVVFSAALQTSLQQFENWTGSGSNTFSGLATVYFRHQYQKAKWILEYSFGGAYGVNVIDDMPFKNKDEFKLSGQISHKITHNWAYSASANIRSQFTKGYKSRTEKIKHSNFLSPGYFDIAGGFTYSRKDLPVKVTLSPIGGSITTIIDRDVSQLDMYGVPVGRRIDGKVGPSFDIFFEKAFGANKWLMCRSNLYAFTSYKAPIETPVVRWENTIDLRVTRFLTTSLYAQVYYLKEASTKLQYQYSFTVGLSYTFKNK